jgi:hypothetical protein
MGPAVIKATSTTMTLTHEEWDTLLAVARKEGADSAQLTERTALFATLLSAAVKTLDDVELPCEPGCACSMSQAVSAARAFLADYERAKRGEIVPEGIPVLKLKAPRRPA